MVLLCLSFPLCELPVIIDRRRFPLCLKRECLSGSLLIAGASEEHFQSCLEWKWMILLQLSPLALLVARPCQGEEQKPVMSILFSPTISIFFLSRCGIKKQNKMGNVGISQQRSPISGPASLAGVGEKHYMQ